MGFWDVLSPKHREQKQPGESRKWHGDLETSVSHLCCAAIILLSLLPLFIHFLSSGNDRYTGFDWMSPFICYLFKEDSHDHLSETKAPFTPYLHHLLYFSSNILILPECGFNVVFKKTGSYTSHSLLVESDSIWTLEQHLVHYERSKKYFFE